MGKASSLRKQLKKKDWKKAGPERITKGDIRQVITGKLRDKLHRQESYREVVLDRMHTGAEMLEMKRQIELKDKELSDNAEHYIIEIEWSGMPCPYDILVAAYNQKIFEYGKERKAELRLFEALKTDGLSEKQISEVLKGKYNKDDERIKKLEKNEKEELK